MVFCHDSIYSHGSHLLAKYFKHPPSKSSSLTRKSRANENILGDLAIESSHLQILQKLQENHISISLLIGFSVTWRTDRNWDFLKWKWERKWDLSSCLAGFLPAFQGNTLFPCPLYLQQNLSTGERKSGCNKMQIYFVHRKGFFPISWMHINIIKSFREKKITTQFLNNNLQSVTVLVRLISYLTLTAELWCLLHLTKSMVLADILVCDRADSFSETNYNEGCIKRETFFF